MHQLKVHQFPSSMRRHRDPVPSAPNQSLPQQPWGEGDASSRVSTSTSTSTSSSRHLALCQTHGPRPHHGQPRGKIFRMLVVGSTPREFLPCIRPSMHSSACVVPGSLIAILRRAGSTFRDSPSES